MDNSEVIKTLTSSSLATGGSLNPEQLTEFVRVIRGSQDLLGKIRFEVKSNPKSYVDALHVGEPISEKSTENTAPTNTAGILLDRVEYSCVDLRSWWYITTKTLKSNISQEDFERQVMESMSQRIGADQLLLALQGDTDIDEDTPRGRLLKALDGYLKQAESAHVVDAGGANISEQVFRAAMAALPDMYGGAPDLAFIVSKVIYNDWMEVLAGRGTALGDAALTGKGVPPFGIPVIACPEIPSNLSCPTSAATPGRARGSRSGPFLITAGENDKMKIQVDDNAGGAVTVTLNPGVQYAGEIATTINNADAQLAGIASEDEEGRLVLTSPTTGAASEIDIQDVAHNAYDTLGLAVGAYAGSDAGDNTIDEGSELLLTPLSNMVFILLDDVRVYPKFEPAYDRIESYVYWSADAKFENLNAVVKVKNIRRKAIVIS